MGTLRQDYREIMRNRRGGSALATAYWDRVREAVAGRAAGRCEICGGEGTDAHHLKYSGVLCDELRNLRWLLHCCRDCHVMLDRYRAAFGTRTDVTFEDFLRAME